MATKRKTKSVKATVVVPAFNKKNAVAFGDGIFSTKHGVISCVKLCSAELQGDRDGNRTMHCAVGEAYATFVNPSLKNVNQKNDPTGSAIQALVERANLKDNSQRGRDAMEVALNTCVRTNDAGHDSDPLLSYIRRAQAVAETWNERVVPLLK